METKKTIRERLLRKRATRPVDPVRAGQAATQRLGALPELKSARAVAAYCAFQGEIDIRPFIRWAREREIAILLPRFNRRDNAYEFAEIADIETDTEPGMFGIMEPAARQPAAPPEQWRAADTGWLIPGVAFDALGNRIGRGAGHYDTLLRGVAGIRIGIAFDWQIMEELLPVDSYDVHMHIVVSERRVIRCRRHDRDERGETQHGKGKSWI
jgi:5-formyltetrahydrofolate cyclo-ligase